MIQTDQILKERHSYVAVTNSKTETPAQNHVKLFLFSKLKTKCVSYNRLFLLVSEMTFMQAVTR